MSMPKGGGEGAGDSTNSIVGLHQHTTALHTVHKVSDVMLVRLQPTNDMKVQSGILLLTLLLLLHCNIPQ